MQTVDRIVDILNLLSNHKEGMGIKNISTKIALPLSTTHRVLNALKAKNLVMQDTITKRYGLGVGIITIASGLLNDLDLIKIAKPVMERLSTKYGELIFISVFENDKVVCVDMVNNSMGTKYYVKVGTVMPAYCAASAKIIVSQKNLQEINRILDGENRFRYTENTKLDREEILKDILLSKENGYGVCDEEMERGILAISTPLYNMHGDVNSSITIMLKKHMTKDVDIIISDMKMAAAEISKNLGYVGK